MAEPACTAFISNVTVPPPNPPLHAVIRTSSNTGLVPDTVHDPGGPASPVLTKAETCTVSPTFGVSGWSVKETVGVGRGGKKQVGVTLGVTLAVDKAVAVAVREGVGVAVGVLVGLAVGVDVAVGIGAESSPHPLRNPDNTTAKMSPVAFLMAPILLLVILKVQNKSPQCCLPAMECDGCIGNGFAPPDLLKLGSEHDLPQRRCKPKARSLGRTSIKAAALLVPLHSAIH